MSETTDFPYISDDELYLNLLERARRFRDTADNTLKYKYLQLNVYKETMKLLKAADVVRSLGDVSKELPSPHEFRFTKRENWAMIRSGSKPQHHD